MVDKGVDGYKLESGLPNSWECPNCVKSGAAVKPEVKTEADIIDSGATPNKIIKLGKTASTASTASTGEPDKKPMSYGADSTYAGHQLFSVQGRSDQPKQELRTQLATQILSASQRPEIKREPPYVVRPPPRQLGAEEVYERRSAAGSDDAVDLKAERAVVLEVFKRLTTVDLSSCVLVCKAWAKIAQDPALWSAVKLQHKRVTSRFLSLIAQRQPTTLVLDWAVVGRQQLAWLLPRYGLNYFVLGEESVYKSTFVCNFSGFSKLASSLSPASSSTPASPRSAPSTAPCSPSSTSATSPT